MLYTLFMIQICDPQSKVFVWCLEYDSWEGAHESSCWWSPMVTWCHHFFSLDMG